MNKAFRNPPGMSTDDPAAIVVGEDGLSSIAMKSFTQNSFVDCFSCHDTQRVTDLGGNILLQGKKLNVVTFYQNLSVKRNEHLEERLWDFNV
jgi:hypothetical protein